MSNLMMSHTAPLLTELLPSKGLWLWDTATVLLRMKARHFSNTLLSQATRKSAGDLGLLHGVLRIPAKTGTLFPFLGLSGDGDRLFLAPVSQLENL